MNDSKPILFFDGHCNLCNSSVDFLVKQDKKKRIMIASLQGKAAERFLPEERRSKLNTLVLLQNKELFYRSTAVLKICKILGGWISIVTLPLWLFPAFFRDWVYGIVARNRYKLFGKKNTCRIPTQEELSHFLD